MPSVSAIFFASCCCMSLMMRRSSSHCHRNTTTITASVNCVMLIREIKFAAGVLRAGRGWSGDAEASCRSLSGCGVCLFILPLVPCQPLPASPYQGRSCLGHLSSVFCPLSSEQPMLPMPTTGHHLPNLSASPCASLAGAQVRRYADAARTGACRARELGPHPFLLSPLHQLLHP